MNVQGGGGVLVNVRGGGIVNFTGGGADDVTRQCPRGWGFF